MFTKTDFFFVGVVLLALAGVLYLAAKDGRACAAKGGVNTRIGCVNPKVFQEH